MVLQRGAPVRLWGYTTPGASVVVAATDAAANVTSPPADANGRWEVGLLPRPAGSGINITCFGPNSTTTTITNVAFGDVYWCSGQSNLSGGNTPVNYAFNGSQEASASAAFPWLRVMAAQMVGGSAVPLPELAAAPRIPWSVAGPASVGHFSATCYFAGKALAEALGPAVPIGLIESAWGGTSIQPWLPPAAVPVCGDPPAYPGGWPQKTSCLWNSQTLPFAGMRMSGIIWYQGERLRTLRSDHVSAEFYPAPPLPHPLQASPTQ
jgi:sialate O-acetylesterase